MDEFVSFFDHLVGYFSVHQNKLAVVVIAGLLALGGYGVYQYIRSHKIQNVALDYYRAEKAPAEEALSFWNKIAGMHPPAQLPEIIALQIGGIFAEKQEWGKAAEFFQKSGRSKSLLLQSVGALASATSLENDRKFQEAYDAYQKLSQDPSNPFKEEARLGMARALVGLGKLNDAETILFQILAKGSDAPLPIKSAALSKLIVLKLKGH